MEFLSIMDTDNDQMLITTITINGSEARYFYTSI